MDYIVSFKPFGDIICKNGVIERCLPRKIAIAYSSEGLFYLYDARFSGKSILCSSIEKDFFKKNPARFDIDKVIIAYVANTAVEIDGDVLTLTVPYRYYDVQPHYATIFALTKKDDDEPNVKMLKIQIDRSYHNEGIINPLVFEDIGQKHDCSITWFVHEPNSV